MNRAGSCQASTCPLQKHVATGNDLATVLHDLACESGCLPQCFATCRTVIRTREAAFHSTHSTPGSRAVDVPTPRDRLSTGFSTGLGFYTSEVGPFTFPSVESFYTSSLIPQLAQDYCDTVSIVCCRPVTVAQESSVHNHRCSTNTVERFSSSNELISQRNTLNHIRRAFGTAARYFAFAVSYALTTYHGSNRFLHRQFLHPTGRLFLYLRYRVLPGL